MHSETLLLLSGIVLAGILCQWLAWVMRLPAILLLLLAGIVAGPVTGVLDPDQVFGDLLLPSLSLAVAVILFEGAATLRFAEIRGLGKVVRNLTSFGAVVTWLVTAFATHHFMQFDFDLALLFGALTVVTGPTVIMPMLRTVRPAAGVASVLKWEGIVIDPLGALLAVLVFEFIISSRTGAEGHILATFGHIVLAGLAAGFLAAIGLGWVLRRHFVPEYLRSATTLATVFAVFTTAEVLARESGLLAVTVMGMTLANLKNTEIEDIIDFKETLSLLLISMLFILLAARVRFDQMEQIGSAGLLVVACLMFIARPLAVFLSTIGSELNARERLLVAWIGPRGIVCAAVAAAFSLRLEEAGVPRAGIIVPLAFLVIIGTVLVQSVTATSLARLLGVREPPATGFLIIGAGIVGRTLGKALVAAGFRVVVADTNWENVSAARMEGLNAFYGNPVSDHADIHLDLAGLGHLLAASGRSAYDILACVHFTPDFGARNVYELRVTSGATVAGRHLPGVRHRGRPLFGEGIDHGTLANWLRAGAEIRTTPITGEYTFDRHREQHGENMIPLFALDPGGKLHVFTGDAQVNPKPDWKVISLVRT